MKSRCVFSRLLTSVVRVIRKILRLEARKSTLGRAARVYFSFSKENSEERGSAIPGGEVVKQAENFEAPGGYLPSRVGELFFSNGSS